MRAVQESLFPAPRASIAEADIPEKLEEELAGFDHFGKRTVRDSLPVGGGKIPLFLNEFWTSRQRAASSLHEISYRACFKPQLPRFFVERLTRPGEIVYDPFMGRGTTLVEAALLGRTPFGCDVNPLSAILVRARLHPPGLMQIRERLEAINLTGAGEYPEDLLAFYHPETLKEICALKRYLQRRKERGALDGVDHWIWMVATNRLTGHSPGFFSVYTLPPNQAVSVDSQVKINQKRGQKPPRRSVPGLILRKSERLLADVDDAVREQLLSATSNALLLTKSSDNTPEIQSNSVALVVTSPPFLDVVDYKQDNWLRAWFCGIDTAAAAIWQKKDLATWEESMAKVLTEIRRVLRPGGWVAFEVGEIRNGRIKLETSVLKVGVEAGLHPVLGLINDQVFTKTSNCWGVQNLRMGTNTNRIILFQKRSGF
jgi:hypothetical protein